MELSLSKVREQFPALQGKYLDEIHADAPGGTQVPSIVADAVRDYLLFANANLGAPFRSSIESTNLLKEAGEAVQAFLNSAKDSEIVFGQNMTTLTFHLARSLTKTFGHGDLIVSTQMDHEANISPWDLAARDSGCQFELVRIKPSTCRLDETHFQELLKKRPSLVAFTAASNATGLMNPVKKLTQLAHEAGALVFVDAVHFAPHRIIDVQDWDCDFLACSAYKFFGPHVGILYGKEKLLNNLPGYKVRPAPNTLPGKWMTGTQNHEGIAGVLATIRYLASLGLETTKTYNLRKRLEVTYKLIHSHEEKLAKTFLDGVKHIPQLRLLGGTESCEDRVATFSLFSNHVTANTLAEALAQKGIFAYGGNFYAQTFMETMGLEANGGVLRLGFVHYNTQEEIEKILHQLQTLLT